MIISEKPDGAEEGHAEPVGEARGEYMQNGTIEIEKVAEVCLETDTVKEKGRSKTIILGDNDIQDIRVKIGDGDVYISIQKGHVNVLVFDGTPEIKGKLDITGHYGLKIDARVNGEGMHFSNRETL